MQLLKKNQVDRCLCVNMELSSRNIKLKKKKQNIICSMTSPLTRTKICTCNRYHFLRISKCMYVPLSASLFLSLNSHLVFCLRHSTRVDMQKNMSQKYLADRKETENKSPTFRLGGLWEGERERGEAEGQTCGNPASQAKIPDTKCQVEGKVESRGPLVPFPLDRPGR